MIGEKLFGIVDSQIIYLNGEELLGEAKIKLPDLEFENEEFKAAGTMGSVKIASTSRLKAMEAEITFETLHPQTKAKLNPSEIYNLVCITAVPSADDKIGKITAHADEVILRGQFYKLGLGDREKGAKMESNLSFNVFAIKMIDNGVPVLEYDALNGVFKINGLPASLADFIRGLI